MIPPGELVTTQHEVLAGMWRINYAYHGEVWWFTRGSSRGDGKLVQVPYAQLLALDPTIAGAAVLLSLDDVVAVLARPTDLTAALARSYPEVQEELPLHLGPLP